MKMFIEKKRENLVTSNSLFIFAVKKEAAKACLPDSRSEEKKVCTCSFAMAGFPKRCEKVA